MGFGEGHVGEFVVKRAGKLGFEAVADGKARRGAAGGADDGQRMVGAGDDGVAAVEREGNAAGRAGAFHGHGQRAKCGRLDEDRQFFDRGDEDVAAVGLAPKHGREQADHRLAADRIALVIPRAVTGDAHLAVAAVGGIPTFDRGQGAFANALRKLIEGLAGEVDRRLVFGHLPGFRAPVVASASKAALRRPDCFVTAFLAMTILRTAIVTGGGKRVGAAIVQALLDDRWRVVAHVHHEGDAVPDGAVKVVADLADPDCAKRIFAAAAGPVRLLVNNAARFAHDGFGAASAAEFDAHMAVNARAPMLLIDEMARRHAMREEGGGEALVVNITDAKLAAPNPDYLSYTLSKYALDGLTRLAARALAGRGIRVMALAPALMLPSGAQGEREFAAVHALNPLGRGVEVGDAVRAIRFLIDQPAMTGETLLIDGGQQQMALPRDVQFLEKQ